MGMFDYIYPGNEIGCPSCGFPINGELQTKDGHCVLGHYSLDEFERENGSLDSYHIYGDCCINENCKKYLSLQITPPEFTPRKVKARKEQF